MIVLGYASRIFCEREILRSKVPSCGVSSLAWIGKCGIRRRNRCRKEAAPLILLKPLDQVDELLLRMDGELAVYVRGVGLHRLASEVQLFGRAFLVAPLC